MKRLMYAFVCVLLGPMVVSAFGDTTKFPTFGVAFTPPEHANPGLSASDGCVALYEFDRNSPYAGADVLVEWTPANGSDASALADGLIKDHGGTIDPGKFTIGGEKAVKMSAEFHVGDITRRVTYLVVHGKSAYMFSALNTASVQADKAVDALLPTVTFSDPESPTKHAAEISDTVVPLFDVCTVRLPVCVRKSESEAGRVDLVINDLTTDPASQHYAVDIEPIKTEQPVSFADIKPKFSEIMEKKYLPDGQHFAWHDEDGLPALHFTEPFMGTIKNDDGSTQMNHMQICMLDIKPGLLVEFTIITDDLPKDQVAAYQAVSNKLLANIKLMDKK